MIDYLASFTYTNGASFPNTLSINATGAGTADGTEIIKLLVDDLWGARQALMDSAGLTPDSVTEAPGTSQLLDAIRKISGSPGEGLEWWKNSDPATTGDRVLLLNGQGVLRANYPELDAAVYVGDGNNATASAFYHADDSAGTIRNTTGIYLILPDTRGYVLRGLDVAASVDPDGAGRDLGSIQDYGMDFVASFEVQANDLGNPIVANSSGDMIILPLGGAADVRVTSAGGSTNRTAIGLGGGQYANFADEVRMVNVATKYAIRY